MSDFRNILEDDLTMMVEGEFSTLVKIEILYSDGTIQPIKGISDSCYSEIDCDFSVDVHSSTAKCTFRQNALIRNLCQDDRIMVNGTGYIVSHVQPIDTLGTITAILRYEQ